jgi:hypothetical protein
MNLVPHSFYKCGSGTWWCVCSPSYSGTYNLEDHGFKASLGSASRLVQKEKRKKERRKEGRKKEREMIEKCKQIGIDIIDISPSPTHPVRTRDQASQFPL